MALEFGRRRLLQILAGLPFVGAMVRSAPRSKAASLTKARVRPGDPKWPSDEKWAELGRKVGGRLINVRSPLSPCVGAPFDAACTRVFQALKNPYYLGDEVGLTQSLGWVEAWTSEPSVYAVAAETTEDVVAAVNFARENNLRLVIKGGGHSYQGSSNAPDSLLIWTRRMTSIDLHDAFVGAGCEGREEPHPAVSIGAGAIWRHVYDAVAVRAGRYVQGGGCMTVGVAGLVLGGGFGSFSKAFGMAGANLLEAEIVTADGAVKIANACSNPDLFWALKGGGGGFGVVTRVTVRTHEMPKVFGAVFGTIRATSDEAYRRLVAKILEFYREALFNPNWGEQIGFRPDRIVSIAMVFQGLDRNQAKAIWRPFVDWLSTSPQDFAVAAAPKVVAGPARNFWDPAALRQIPSLVIADDRAGAPAENIFWATNLGEAGVVWRAYQSAWLPATLLEPERRESLADALVVAARRGVELHFNKGLAGGSADAIAAAKETATNPRVAEAFALAIAGAYEQPAYPGVAGHEPDIAAAKRDAAAVTAAMDAIRKLLPQVASYVWETDYFQPDWQDAFWGENYARLLAVKNQYDPDGLFFLHHGVGSERWSADGFSRVK
jgi:FAD/FMN-containing dehydrogenase